MAGWLPVGKTTATVVSAHNGGRTQVNIGLVQSSGDYPFINHYKNGQDLVNANDLAYPTPDLLTPDGYPASLAKGGTNNLFFIPLMEDRPGDYVVKWKGPAGSSVTVNGTIHGSMVAPSLDAGRYTFTPTANRISCNIISLGVSDVVVCHVDDEAAYDTNQVFGIKFKQRLVAGNFGVIRHMNTSSSNDGNVSQWKYRKPVSYSAYGTRELRLGIYAGAASVLGSAYSVGDTPNGFVLEDKTMVQFSAISTALSTGPAPWTLDVNHTGAFPMVNKYINVGVNGNNGLYATQWTAVFDALLGLWITEPGGILSGWPPELQVRLCAEVGAHCHFSSPTYGFETCNDYWHTGLATYCRDNKPAWMTIIMEGPNETWNSEGGPNQIWYANTKQMKRNGWSPYPYTVPGGFAISAIVNVSPVFGAGYVDLTLSNASSLIVGSCLRLNDMSSSGITGLNQSVWVVAKNVGGNANKITAKHLTAFSGTYTGSGGVASPASDDSHGWYGRGMAQMGAAWAAVFGTTKGWPHYAISIGVQTGYGFGGFVGCDSHVERFESHGWVVEGGLAAKTYADAYCPATYYGPSVYGSLVETEDAFNYCVTSRSNSTTRATLLAAYIGTLYDVSTTRPTLPYILTEYTNWRDYVKAKGVTRAIAYEGGYSPDYVPPTFPYDDGWWGSMCAVAGANKATSCVVTLGTTYHGRSFLSTDPNLQFPTTNPIKPGMLFFARNILGMTQLNNCECVGEPGYTGFNNLTFIGGGSANITYTGAKMPAVGQGIVFIPVNNGYGNYQDTDPTHRFPPPLELRVPYYVVFSSGSTIRIALNKTDPAITFATGADTSAGIAAVTGWMVLSKSGQNITIDCDSTLFSTWTAGAGQWMHVAASDWWINVYRSGSKQAPELVAANTKHYTDYASVTDATFTALYPSNYSFTALGNKHLGNPGYDGNVWSIQCDLYQTPDSPQFQSAATYNH
jgi:hypothetical protein